MHPSIQQFSPLLQGRSVNFFIGGRDRGGCVGKLLQLFLLFWKNLQFLEIIGKGRAPPSPPDATRPYIIYYSLLNESHLIFIKMMIYLLNFSHVTSLITPACINI